MAAKFYKLITLLIFFSGTIIFVLYRSDAFKYSSQEKSPAPVTDSVKIDQKISLPNEASYHSLNNSEIISTSKSGILIRQESYINFMKDELLDHSTSSLSQSTANSSKPHD